MTETGNHVGSPRPPSQMTTIGAIARIGIVCEATMYGSNPRRRKVQWTSRTAMRKPPIAPSAKPTTASFAVKSAESQSTSMSSGPFRREGSKSWPTMSQVCGIVRSFTSNGRVKPAVSQIHL